MLPGTAPPTLPTLDRSKFSTLRPGSQPFLDSWLAASGCCDSFLCLGLVASGSFEAESKR